LRNFSTLFHKKGWGDAKLFGKATGEIFGIVEANLEGYLCHIAVGIILEQHILGYLETITAHKFGGGLARLCGDDLAEG